ncbi:MAG: hypothetical protein FWE57_01280 [Chitinispirillia bacterium]|nr:hypothetical protein [Chitinispirillia bacterium]
MKNLKNSLAKPGRDAQPWAMWVWNLSITSVEIEKQLTALIGKGFGGVVIRPGRDMSPAYMSQEFIENFGIVLEIAKRNGIKVRLSDDLSLSWSGSFDSILNQSKKNRAEYLALESETAPALGTLECEIALDPQGSYIAQAVKKNSASMKSVQIPANKSNMTWKAPGADWSLFLYKKIVVRDPAGSAVLNVINPKLAAVYIQNTLDVLRTNFSKYIPTTFEGFVTELPALRPGDNAILWDDEAAAKYKSKYKKDLVSLLPMLFSDAPGAHRTRVHVHTFIFNMIAERFTAPIEAWVKKYRLSQWTLWPETGVYRPENSLRDSYVPPDSSITALGLQNLDGSLENYALLRTIADINTNQYRRETVTVIGRNRLGAGNTIQSLKQEIDLSLLAGQSHILFDGFFFNIDRRGYYKTPCSPAWYSPEWDHLQLLCNYSARSQEALKGMHASREVALLNPVDSIISEYLPGNSKTAVKSAAAFEKAVNALYGSGFGFDVISEELLLSCAVRQNGEFGTTDRIRKGNYKALTVAYAPFITRSLLVFLEKLAAKGTTIIFVDEAPKGTYEDGETATVTARIQKLLASRGKSVYVCSASDLDQPLSNIKPEIVILRENGDRPDIAVQTYHTEGGKIYMLHNLSDTDEQTVVAEMPFDKYFAAINCQTGRITDIELVDADKTAARARLHLLPLQTLIVVSCSSKLSAAGQTAPAQGFNPFALPARSYRIVFKEQWSFAAQSMNVLPLSNWNIRIGFSRETGQFSHYYETTFEARSIPDYCVFMLSGLGHSSVPFAGNEISVNGAKIEKEVFSDGRLQTKAESSNSEIPFSNDGSLEKLFGEKISYYDIRKKLTKGMNRISVRTAASAVEPQTLVYPPLVMGNFSIAKGPQGWALDKQPLVVGHDSWTKYGYPFLSGRAAYTQTFEVPNDYEKLILRLSQVSGTVYVKINGTDAGALHWHPMELDITPYCTSQRNELTVEVVNTVDNVLRLNGRPSGLTGEVFIDVYKAS